MHLFYYISSSGNTVCYLVFVIDELQSKSGIGQLHGLKQGSIGRLARLQRTLAPVQWTQLRVDISSFFFNSPGHVMWCKMKYHMLSFYLALTCRRHSDHRS